MRYLMEIETTMTHHHTTHHQHHPPITATHGWQPTWHSSVDDVGHFIQFLYTNWLLIALACLAATPAVGGITPCTKKDSSVSCDLVTRYLDNISCLAASASNVITCKNCDSLKRPPPLLEINPPWAEGTTPPPTTTPTMTMTSSTTVIPVTNATSTTSAASTTTGASSTTPPLKGTTTIRPPTKVPDKTTPTIKVTKPLAVIPTVKIGKSGSSSPGRITGIVFAILIPLIVFIVIVIWVRCKARPGTRGRYSVQKAITRVLGNSRRNPNPSSNSNGGATPNNQQTEIEIGTVESGLQIGNGGSPVRGNAEQEITSDQEEAVNSQMLNTNRGSSLSPEPEGTSSRKSSNTPVPDVRRPSRQLRMDSQSLLVDNMDEDMSDTDDDGGVTDKSFEKHQAMLGDGLGKDGAVIVEEDAFEDVNLGDEDKTQNGEEDGKTKKK